MVVPRSNIEKRFPRRDLCWSGQCYRLKRATRRLFDLAIFEHCILCRYR